MASNISVTGATIALTIGNIPLPVLEYDASSDMWNPASIQTASSEMSQDGVHIAWTKRAVISVTMNLVSSSPTNIALEQLLLRQPKGKLVDVTAVVNNNGKTEIYKDGVLTDGAPGKILGSEKESARTWIINFGSKA